MSDQPDSPLVLDTHSWVWLLEGREDLGSMFISAAEAASRDGRLYVCSISIAEVALYVSAGRIRLVVPVTAWLQEAVETPGLRVLDVDIAMAVEAAGLPGDFPGDAADRMIVAAARLAGGRLATADPGLQRYAREGHLSVLGLADPSGDAPRG